MYMAKMWCGRGEGEGGERGREGRGGGRGEGEGGERGREGGGERKQN